MISSVDGRLLPERWSKPAVSRHDSSPIAIYENMAIQFNAQAWVVGRNTLQSYVTSSAEWLGEKHYDGPSIPREPWCGDRRGHNLAIVCDTRAKLSYSGCTIGDEHLVTILSKSVSDAYLSALKAMGISWVFAGEDGSDLEEALEQLSSVFGVNILLLEGGGILNGEFFAAGLIDELSLLIYPAIDGLSGIPSIFEYRGSKTEQPSKGQSLRHLNSKTLDNGTVWIHYKIQKYEEE